MPMNITSSISLPPDTASRTIGILSQKGWGKTYTGLKLTELLLAQGCQTVVMDPTGVWWGLKAEGTGPGFPVLVMGGDHGDVPLEHTSGAVVAEFVVRTGQSVVLDLSGFESNAKQDRFVTDFAEALYRLKAKSEHRTPLHLMLDEADSFAPQRPQHGQQRMLGAMEAIVRRGRSRGLGMTLITQRPAVINKNLLSQVDMLIIGRITGPHDMKAVKEWTDLSGAKHTAAAFAEKLSKLENGQAFFWSPQWLGLFEQGRVLAKRTFDSSSTPLPGEARKAPKLAAVNLEVLTAEIRATVESAKQNDPKALKAEIERLKAEVAKGGASQDELDKAFTEGFDHARKEIASRVSLLCSPKHPNRGDLRPKPEPFEVVAPAPVAKRDRPTLEENSGPPAKPASSSSEERVLTALYWTRNEKVDPSTVAFYAGYTVNGTFNGTMTKLRRAGLVEGWQITPAGIHQVPLDAGDKPTGPQLREWIRPKVGTAENRVLDVLVGSPGINFTIQQLAEYAGYTVNGTFNGALTKLRKLNLIRGGARDGIAASAILF